jgi:hypothetical protein
MSARKKTSTQGNMDRVRLMSDHGELPGYNVDDYADRLTVARRKFDRLCRFSLDEHETSFESGGKQLDWGAERKRRREVLDRWLRDTYAVMGELLKLFHQVRNDQTVLEVFSLEHSSRRSSNLKMGAGRRKVIS